MGSNTITPEIAMLFTNPVSRALTVTALLASTTLLSGCLINGSSSVRTEGRFIGDSTLGQIKPGKTDKAWILASLGEPTRRSSLTDDINEVWVWDYRKIKHNESDLFLIFDSDKRTEISQHVYVEFDGDLVSRAWSDRGR
jgi:outer membrane protein assembly factor BamE (lipoprotein component of BamABCDE complex)